MLDHLRRPTALLLTALLPAGLALSACGEDDSDGLEGFDAVSVSGPVGEKPELDWKGRLAPGKPRAKVLTEGDGPELAEGDVARIEFTLANGYTQKVIYDTNDGHTLAALLKVGSEAEPQSLQDVLLQSVAAELEPGTTVGTRLAVTVSSERVIGDYLGNAQASQLFASLDIGNEDGLLFVADVVGTDELDGTARNGPAWAPEVVEKDGLPTSLDFAGTPAPSGALRTAVLVNGTGPKVKAGQSVLVNYLGQIRSSKKPFDESFSKGAGFQAVVGGPNASVVKGWSQGLVGLPVGTRVLLEIPPALGYGKEGQGKDIPPNSTLYFVVDILDAADPEPAPEPEETASPSGSASPSGTASQEPSGTPSE